MKIHPTVAAAKSVADEKAKEVASAKEVVQRLEREHSEALVAVREAQAAVDATLPQCRLVKVQWRSGKESDSGRVAIVRRTPGGMLVARRLGDPPERELKFKWREHSAKYVEITKFSSFVTDQMELRDVPDAYLGSTKA